MTRCWCVRKNGCVRFWSGLLIPGLPVRLHTPNALHIRLLTPDICRLLHRAGLTTIRSGTGNNAFCGAVGQQAYAVMSGGKGCSNLLDAGFQADQIGIYVLFGLPGQEFAELASNLESCPESRPDALYIALHADTRQQAFCYSAKAFAVSFGGGTIVPE